MEIVWSRRGLLVTAATALLLAPARTALAAPDRPDSGAGAERGGARLRELERAYGGRIGAFAVNTANGAVAGHRATEPFPLLSTFKALAAAAVLHTAHQSDHGLLERVIHWTSDDLVDYSPITGQHVDTGLTVAQLCEAAVTVSDNTAGNLLLRQLGGPHGITRFARHLGDHATRLDRWEPELNDWTPTEQRDLTTPAAAGRDLLALTVRDALVPQDRDRLIGWLLGSQTGGARIRAGLPATWTVGDKTGTGPSYGTANDIAIAWPPGASPLIISIYTNRTEPTATVDNAVVATAATILAEAVGAL